MFNDIVFDCKTVESEKIGLYSVEELNKENIIDHLKFLIPLALDKEFKTGILST